jgi:hypothetical protein
VTVSEFMFLAMGLVLGVASGAALVEIIRARPPARREVRVTVAQDAIPRRRATTLADDAFVAVGPEPARGGPADRRGEEGPVPDGSLDRRTHVLSATENAPPGAGDPNGSNGRLVGMRISAGADPMFGALRAMGRERPATQHEASAEPSAVADPHASPSVVGLLDPPVPVEAAAGAATGAPAAAPTYSGPCAEERRIADERCELATRAQAQAQAAADALRRAQRAHDTRTAAAEAAAEAANPRNVRTLKEDAQRAFRSASRTAASPDAVEDAARAWLQDINRINREAAAATLTAEREHAAAAAVLAGLERLSQAVDATRVGARMAEVACLEARTAVADCDERSHAAPGSERVAPVPTDTGPQPQRGDEALEIALEGGTLPRIFRLLRGDAEAMEHMVGSLSGDDPEEAGRWKLALAGLLDAIQADAIDQGFLRYPEGHAFWGPYTQEQDRDITRALGSLGYRHDGLGGWVDERQPSQRELSLALGYAGLDPMRVRNWPNTEQTRELFAEVEVAADEYLAGVAGDLTLAEMIEMLGRRADNLVELWNHWGRVRPLLLEER